VRLILSRKGFDSAAGGCPSPIFPDGSMLSLPIPSKGSPHRYSQLSWRGHNVGELVERLTRGKVRRDFDAHLDPDLRRDLCPRPGDWRAAFGQVSSAQGHLRKQGVAEGDLFLFWGLFRRVDEQGRWIGRPEHHLWGWMQVGLVAPVDAVVRKGGASWSWARGHPHLHRPEDPTNTLYLAAEHLRLPKLSHPLPGAGTFDVAQASRRLSCAAARTPSEWCLPEGFKTRREAPPLSYHADSARWSQAHGRTHLRVVSRGQEFVLNLDRYPGVVDWVAGVIGVG